MQTFLLITKLEKALMGHSCLVFHQQKDVKGGNMLMSQLQFKLQQRIFPMNFNTDKTAHTTTFHLPATG